MSVDLTLLVTGLGPINYIFCTFIKDKFIVCCRVEQYGKGFPRKDPQKLRLASLFIRLKVPVVETKKKTWFFSSHWKITAFPNEWRNIPKCTIRDQIWAYFCINMLPTFICVFMHMGKCKYADVFYIFLKYIYNKLSWFMHTNDYLHPLKFLYTYL